MMIRWSTLEVHMEIVPPFYQERMTLTIKKLGTAGHFGADGEMFWSDDSFNTWSLDLLVNVM